MGLQSDLVMNGELFTLRYLLFQGSMYDKYFEKYFFKMSTFYI